MSRFHRAIFRILNGAQKFDFWSFPVRLRLLRMMGINAAPNALVEAGVDFKVGVIEIGGGAYVNRDCYIDGPGRVVIGERAHIGPRSMLLTQSHTIGDASCRAGALVFLPVAVEAGAWIGAGSQIMPGVQVGAGAIVAAGAVVTRDVPPSCLVAGVPAKFMRSLADATIPSS